MTEPNNYPRLSDALSPEKIRAALAACAPGDRVTWETGLYMVPRPDGGIEPAMVLLLRMASPLIGQAFNHIVVLGLDKLFDRDINDGIREGVEMLQKRRTAALTNGSGR